MMTSTEPSLAAYPVVIELPVLWGQMDAFQHVNNTVYFRYFESARIAYGDRIGTHEFMQTTGIGPILAATSCRFLSPLRYPDTVLVGCRTLRLEAAVMDQEYAVFSRRQQRLAATGTGQVVAYDYQRLKKSAYPEELLERVRRLEHL